MWFLQKQSLRRSENRPILTISWTDPCTTLCKNRNEFKSNTFNFMLHHKLSFVALAQNNIQSFKISSRFLLIFPRFLSYQTAKLSSGIQVHLRERERRVTNMMRGFIWGREREWSTVREEDWISELRFGFSRASSATSMAFQMFTAPIFLSFWLFSFICKYIYFFLQFATLLICPLSCAKSLKTRKIQIMLLWFLGANREVPIIYIII